MRFDLKILLHVSIAVLVIVAVSVISTEAAVNTTDLSVYYHFDGEGETVKDSSVNGNHGKIVGNISREEGVYGNAIALETNTWIDMNGPEFKNVPVDGFTIAVWVNHTGSTAPQTLLDAIGTDHGNGLFHMEIRTAGFRFFHRDGTNTNVFNINPGPVIDANTWVHFAGTYDSSNGEVKTYINGEETHSKVEEGKRKLATNWGATAGIGHHKNDRWFDGLLDEYYIFGRALPADEISEVMNGALLAVEPAEKLTTTWGNIKSHR